MIRVTEIIGDSIHGFPVFITTGEGGVRHAGGSSDSSMGRPRSCLCLDVAGEDHGVSISVSFNGPRSLVVVGEIDKLDRA